ncbi:MAG: hypothetical protein GWM88_05530 [Pseudomonadales bacterium]|nr:hypothetical protein [Pseudomonadales bacterium]NIX07496.1 hypothetical protein [Pseudomonadales bacterium]
MYPDDLPLSESLRNAHDQALEKIVLPGPFWTGVERHAMAEAARAADGCALCAARKRAPLPSGAEARHDGAETLAAALVDAIHRIRTDPGRLTKRWFDSVAAEIGEGPYVEMVSVVSSLVIVDTLHRSLGQALPALPDPVAGPPTGEPAGDVVDAGAWVPITRAPRDMADTGLPAVPNIFRAMGLVPRAVELFFGTFRPHYALKDIKLSLSQAQAEYVASRVSAMNECFY